MKKHARSSKALTCTAVSLGELAERATALCSRRLHPRSSAIIRKPSYVTPQSAVARAGYLHLLEVLTSPRVRVITTMFFGFLVFCRRLNVYDIHRKYIAYRRTSHYCIALSENTSVYRGTYGSRRSACGPNENVKEQFSSLTLPMCIEGRFNARRAYRR